MSDRVEILVGGVKYAGWQTARVTRSIETLSGSFSLEVTERWANRGKPWPIGEGDACTVIVNGEPLITGFIDSREPSFGSAEHSVTISGRDLTGDAVDSSAVLDAWEFSNVDVVALVRKLLAPFGIKVALQAGIVLPPASIPKKYSIDPGDTVATAIENLCRVAGLLAMSDGRGGVVLTRAGTERCTTALVEGKNLKGGRAVFSTSGRFRKYLVLGQHKGNSEFHGAESSAVRGTAEDPNVTRSSRVLVVRPEGNLTAAQAKKRAEWEAAVRAARATSVVVPVAGWTQADGSLWPINKLVTVKSPTLGVHGSLLIARTTFALSVSGGTTAELELKPPDAFNPDPLQLGGGGNNYWKEIVKGVTVAGSSSASTLKNDPWKELNK